jgi:hypothetical protein
MLMNGKQGGKVCRQVPTADLTNFQKEVQIVWKQKNLVAVCKLRAMLRDWMLKGKYIRVETFAFFNYTDLFTQKGIPKRMDASNRIKALHDSLAGVLEVDDCWFWDAEIRKREIHGAEPWCAVRFFPVEHMNLKTMKERGIL